MTKKLKIGNLWIGGGEPVLIQSMTNTDTADTEATRRQICQLYEAGCEIVRVAAYDLNSAANIANLKSASPMPIVADVHFDYKIAIKAIESGADKVRINPGNIGGKDKVRQVVDAAKAHHVPIRVGSNAGSIHKEYQGMALSDALVESALLNVRMLEEQGFYDMAISLKASSVRETVKAYRRMAQIVDYPLHLGVTEAGLREASVIKSAMGIGALLLDGIGDTIRVSVTGDPVEEIAIAKGILKYAGLRSFGPEVVSCPTCGRTKIDLETLAKKVSQIAKEIDKPLKIAVMGCAVNGPGEARDADIGIAGGRGEGLIFLKGQIYKKLPERELLEEFRRVLKSL